MKMKKVEKSDWLKVLVCLDKGSRGLALMCGLKLDDIESMEWDLVSGWIRVITQEHHMNLKVQSRLIEW
jgi:hypothetical protein